jgi:S1-C subfamily serine protease
MSVLARLATLLLALALAAGGCVAAPSDDYEPVSVDDASRISADDLALRRDGAERAIREGTLRVRARGCFGVGSGSGFAVAERVLATNRHVVDGADVIQVSTWDGQSIDVEISGIAITNDLAVVATRQPLPESLPQAASPPAGTEIAAVGYPRGNAIDFAWGRVLDYVDGAVFNEAAQTMRVDAHVVEGNSGGPVVDLDGNVVAVVFAIELATGHGLAIPIEMLRSTAVSRGFFTNPSDC